MVLVLLPACSRPLHDNDGVTLEGDMKPPSFEDRRSHPGDHTASSRRQHREAFVHDDVLAFAVVGNGLRAGENQNGDMTR